MYSRTDTEREGLLWDRGSPQTLMVSPIKPVGLKLDISADIQPRDNSLGTKVFTLVPKDAKNVRDVKSFIANSILKTSTPFQVFVFGDYRIRDEESAQIFSVINEPCRLVPMPLPRSALSSTPKSRSATSSILIHRRSEGGNFSGNSSSSGKRVTFFDGDSSASPVERGFAMDVLDHSGADPSTQAVIQSPQKFLATSTPKSSAPVQNFANKDDVNSIDPEEQDQEGGDEDDPNSTGERRKRRRRRHRTRRSKVNLNGQTSDQDTTESRSTPAEVEINYANSSSTNSSASECQLKRSLRKRPGESLDESEKSNEDKIKISSNPKSAKLDKTADNFEFVTPSVIRRSTRKQSATNLQDSLMCSNKKRSSAFSSPPSSDSFSSSISSAEGSKPRQDTPIVPRVIKSPRYFESALSARKIINNFDVEVEDPSRNRSNSVSVCDNTTPKTVNETDAIVKCEGEEAASKFVSISIDDISVGDKLTFKVLELDEHYRPSLSNFKEGIVVGKAGTELSIRYTKNDLVVRNGMFEVHEDGNAESNSGEEANVECLQFSQLQNPTVTRCSSDPENTPASSS